jgi:hypothetical protein
MSTVWRRVATIAVGSGEENVHRLATGGYDRGGSGEEDVHRLATGGYDRGGSGEEDVHRLANGGYDCRW